MFKKIETALEFMHTRSLKNVEQKNLQAVLNKYNNVEKQLKTVHVTGTNGKGSTSKMVNDILIAANYKVGLFTSPHMVVANDRIRINNEYICDQDLMDYINYFYQDIINFNLNFFQVYVLIMFQYFYDKQVDLAVIEVGIGGRLDSTNVIDSLVSIITNINYDHTKKLGNSLKDIAYEKSGIIKNNSTTITMVSDKSLLEIIKKQVDNKDGELIVLTAADSVLANDKLAFTFNYKDYQLNSQAKYQVLNAQIAITAVNILKDKHNYKISDNDIKTGLDNFSWVGRFEKISQYPSITLDGAHNIGGIKALIKSIDLNKKYVVIFSALKDKDYLEMLEHLMASFTEVVFCEFDFSRSLKKEEINFNNIRKFSKFSQALDYLNKKYPQDEILVCGSLYFISDVRNQIIG